MSIAKISILIGASIVTTGTSAAVATRDKWWPNSKSQKGSKDPQVEESNLKEKTALDQVTTNPGTSGPKERGD